MLFIATCSDDSTTSLLIPYLLPYPVFRFDIDCFSRYRWDFTGNGFLIEDSDGNSISSESLSCFYLRKPIFFDAVDVPKDGCLENWRREEILCLIQDLYRDCYARGICALVHPVNARWDKPRQMRLAQKYFKVPEWHLFHGKLPVLPKGKCWVAKTLTQTQIGSGKTFFVRSVVPQKLDPDYPWFIQEKVDGDEDVTVVYVRGRCFSYSVSRGGMEFEDIRMYQEQPEFEWHPCNLSELEAESMRNFMRETGYDFGRFDFIRKDGVLYFLELNPNGQWAWLDIENKNGMISTIANEILKVCHRYDNAK